MINFYHIILRHSDRLASIIDDLLQLSKLEGGLEQYLVDYEFHDVQTIITSLLLIYRTDSTVQNVSIQLLSNMSKSIMCNRSLVHQAISNLVDNAVKYSESDCEVLDIKQQDQHVIFYIKDQGGGISEEHHAKLFQRFYRVDKSRSRDMGGTGLGLSIVKHIVTAHGGDVGVYSVPNGSCFWIKLPLW